MQSGPGSLVSAFLSTSLSPVCGLDVFTTPVPQPIWSTREQSPPRMFTKKVGTTKPGWSQHPCVARDAAVRVARDLAARDPRARCAWVAARDAGAVLAARKGILGVHRE